MFLKKFKLLVKHYTINTDYCAEIVRVAESQVGYKEKASNSDLDSFTANAGSAN